MKKSFLIRFSAIGIGALALTAQGIPALATPPTRHSIPT